jgi:hypothetical protein
MKNMTITIIALLLFAGCGDEQQNEQQMSIYGTWQLVEQRFGNVSNSGSWENVPDGYTMEFGSDQKYISSSNAICKSNPSNTGTFNLTTSQDGSIIVIELECEESENNLFSMEYLYTFKNGYLLFSPIFSCDEGCSYKFKKIVEPQTGAERRW